MKKSKHQTINIREDEMTEIQIEIDKPLIDFYKKETGRSRVTLKGLSDFINHLINIHKTIDC